MFPYSIVVKEAAGVLTSHVSSWATDRIRVKSQLDCSSDAAARGDSLVQRPSIRLPGGLVSFRVNVVPFLEWLYRCRADGTPEFMGLVLVRVRLVWTCAAGMAAMVRALALRDVLYCLEGPDVLPGPDVLLVRIPCLELGQ